MDFGLKQSFKKLTFADC